MQPMYALTAPGKHSLTSLFLRLSLNAGAQPMPVTALPLDPGARAPRTVASPARGGDVVGRDEAGRNLIQLAADDWLLEQLLSFHGGSEDLEDANDDEPDDCRRLVFD
jgi:hypothetical protein